jgi:hypothetical protein
VVSAPRLLALDFDRVEWSLTRPDGSERVVVVLVGSGSTWFEAIRFPHDVSEGGCSTGNPLIDDEIRRRSSEELVRLTAILALARPGWVA